jgi:hypothetical protein
MEIIKNIGYLWHRKYVNWQSGYELIGYPERGNCNPVNFADQTGIYALYDANFNCIYVGQTGRGEDGLYKRLQDHAMKGYLFCRWERFTWFGFYSTNALLKDSYDKEYKINTNVNELLNVIESLIIRANPPLENIKRGTLKGIEWFYQEAEFEEQQSEFQRLHKTCKSMKQKKST